MTKKQLQAQAIMNMIKGNVQKPDLEYICVFAFK